MQKAIFLEPFYRDITQRPDDLDIIGKEWWYEIPAEEYYPDREEGPDYLGICNTMFNIAAYLALGSMVGMLIWKLVTMLLGMYF